MQSCSSHKLRTKALENPSYTLTQILDAGKAMEFSKAQASNIEDKQSVHKLSSYSGNRSRRYRNKNINSTQDGSERSADKKSRPRKSRSSGHESRKSSVKCRNCGQNYSHPGGNTSCPAYQATCRGCGKLNHFEAVGRSKGKRERRNAHHSTVNKVSENESTDDDELYTFSQQKNPEGPASLQD